MGRMKPAWYWKRQMEEAERRATYFATRTPTAVTAVKSRGASTDLFYRSLFMKVGTNHLLFKVSVNDKALALIDAAKAGLLTQAAYTALTPAEPALPSRGAAMDPTKVHWYKGDSTPQAETTAWQTRYIRYYTKASGTQSHFSMPFSKITTPTVAEVQTAYETAFSGTSKTTLLGAENGRAWIVFEKNSNAIST